MLNIAKQPDAALLHFTLKMTRKLNFFSLLNRNLKKTLHYPANIPLWYSCAVNNYCISKITYISHFMLNVKC